MEQTPDNSSFDLEALISQRVAKEIEKAVLQVQLSWADWREITFHDGATLEHPSGMKVHIKL